MAGFYSEILRVCIKIHLWGLPKIPNSTPILPLTGQVPLDVLGHRTQGAEYLLQQPGPIAKCSLVLGPAQNQQHFRSLGKWAGIIDPNKGYVASKIQSLIRHCVPFCCCCKRVQMQQVIFPF